MRSIAVLLGVVLVGCKVFSFEGSVTFTVEEISDMLQSEVTQTMMGLKRTNETSRGVPFVPPKDLTLPDQVDWRSKGAVTPVKDQGYFDLCWGSWAFSATGAIESAHFIKYGTLVHLSEQQLYDCSTAFGNFGCWYGEPSRAFNYIKASRGIETEKSYPYEQYYNECRYNSTNIGATVSGYVNIESGSEEQLQQAVATVGPVTVHVYTDDKGFDNYKSGVYDGPNCRTTPGFFLNDYSMLAVGYGTTANGTDYWLLKNSFGTSWGIDGYFMLARNKNNTCGVATDASYPIV